MLKEKLIKRVLMVFCLMLVLSIGVVALFIAAAKHHNLMILAATSEHSVSDREPIIHKNVYILSNSSEEISFLTKEGVIDMSLSLPVEENIAGQVADISSIGDLVTSITVKTSRITGSVINVTEDSIEIREYGVIKVSEDFNIFVMDDANEVKNNKEMLLGYEDVEFVICDDMLQAAIPKNRIADNVRVLLTTTGFTSPYHEQVKISGEEDFTVTRPDGTEFGEGNYAKDVEVTFDNSLLNEGESVVVECEGGKIGVLNIERNSETPYYRGRIIVTNTANGFTIINELSVESYLYGVLPSEMPASYPHEALKAQAICARSFVYKQMAGSSYEAFGAHVDDSTNCQVYNNQKESDSIIKAVDETCGEVLMGDGEILKTYYYSTSCGSGAGTEEVWAGDENVFYNSGLYLSDNSVSDETQQVFAVVMPDGFSVDMLEKTSLSEEKAFRDFIDAECVTYTFDNITVKETIKSYDSEYPWYRWSLNENISDYSKVINDRLAETISTFGNKILVLEKGEYVEKEISSIGEIKDIQVTKIGESGIVMELVITGTEHTIKVSMQSAVRQLLAPTGLTVKLSDGTKNTGMSLLPSGFFYVDVAEGKVIINGGGYGHGVGMSQNGAKAMAEAGLGYADILAQYFPGCTVYKNN